MEPDEPTPTPEQVDALPLAERAAVYLAVHARLTARLGLPGA